MILNELEVVQKFCVEKDKSNVTTSPQLPFMGLLPVELITVLPC